MTDRLADARWAELALCAEDAYTAASAGTDAAIVEPAPDPRLSPEWSVAAVVTGQDAFLRKTLDLDARRVFYGWVLRRNVEHASGPLEYALAIRGTSRWAEWCIDAEFLPCTPHPGAGSVESGFWGLYQTLKLRAPNSTDGNELPLVAAVTAMVGPGSLMVIGHSLGAALATYTAVDLADPGRLGKRVSTRLIASPRPGDGLFAQYAGARIADCVGYASPDDIVTKVPLGFDYAALPTTVELPADPPGYVITGGLGGQHHVISYLLRLNPAFDLTSLPAIDQPYLDCLHKAL